MYCLTCPDRDQCREICPRLKRHLRSLESYQRELPLAPGQLVILAEQIGLTYADLLPKTILWEEILPFLASIPRELLTPFILHYYEGIGVCTVARMLGIHRSTVSRRLGRAVVMLRQEMVRQGVLIE